MATAIENYLNSEYEVYSISLDDLMEMPRHQKISPNITEHYTDRTAGALSDIERAASKGERVGVHMHDSASGLMIPVYGNVGHAPGISASYLLELIEDSGSLSAQLREDAMSNIGEVGEIDFYQVTVYHKS